MSELRADALFAARTILGHGACCVLETLAPDGAAWEPRLLAFRSARPLDVAREVEDLVVARPEQAVRLTPYSSSRLAPVPEPPPTVCYQPVAAGRVPHASSAA